MKTLTSETVEALLHKHSAWKLENGELVREWTFPGFPEAVAFVNRVAAVTEEANHHPDIDIRYNRVRLALISHDAGGLTTRDARMVERIDDHEH